MSRRPQPSGRHTIRKRLAILSFSIGLGFGAQALTGQFLSAAQAAEKPLTATHRVLGAEQTAEGLTSLTLEVTVRNGGTEALSGVTLRPFASMPLLPEPQTEPLVIGSVGAGQSVGVVWRATSAYLVEGVTPLMHRLEFAGEANDFAGDSLAFPVESTEVAP